MTPITIRGLRKTFGPTVAVNNIDLDIAAGQLFFLLGPSGCGKTTLLRMIAGFTDPTAGSIRFGDEDVTHLPPNQRNTGMVFQGYALWPHMSVRQNVAFGLEVRKVSKAETNRRVDQALDSVQLTVQADRKINQLSGGQQQRVALARALVIKPTVLLLDEPLSNLDAKLRLEMRRSIRDICKASNITGVYVTHDQKEALSMADGIAVLQAGNVMQVGPPRQLYERPGHAFVADFLGETNFVSATVTAAPDPATPDAPVTLDTPLGPLTSTTYPAPAPAVGDQVTCSIRPETLRILLPPAPPSASATPPPPTPADQPNIFPAVRTDTMYLGEMAQHRLTISQASQLKAFELNPRFATDDAPRDLQIHLDPRDVVILQD